MKDSLSETKINIMKITIIRLLLILCAFLLVKFVLHWSEPLLVSFVFEYIVEPFIVREV